jgi:hypothetical protein
MSKRPIIPDHGISLQRRWITHLREQLLVGVWVVVEVLSLIVCSIKSPQLANEVDLSLRWRLVDSLDMADMAPKAAGCLWQFSSHDRIVGSRVRLWLTHLVVVRRGIWGKVVKGVPVLVGIQTIVTVGVHNE